MSEVVPTRRLSQVCEKSMLICVHTNLAVSILNIRSKILLSLKLRFSSLKLTG